MIKDLLRLKWHAKLSHEQIAATLKVSKGVVAKYVGLARAAGLNWDTVQDWSEQRLTSVLLPKATTSQPYVAPDWGRIHRELDRKGVGDPTVADAILDRLLQRCRRFSLDEIGRASCRERV